MITGIIGGIVGMLLLCYAIFSSTQHLTQSITHWCIGILGLLLLANFWKHTAFYLGMQCIASYVCDNPKTAGKQWNRYTRTLLSWLFTVQVHNETLYNTDRKSPVIFVMNHIAHSRPFDEFCLSLIEQPNLRIVALPRKPGSYPDTILKSSRYVACKHGGGHDEFVSVCREALQEGDSLLLFPEGKNTEKQIHWTQLADFQSGVFELSLITSTPIVPIVFEGFNCPRGWVKSQSCPLRLHYLDVVEPLEFYSPTDPTMEAADESNRDKEKEVNTALADVTYRYKSVVRHRMMKKIVTIVAKSLPDDKAKIYLKDREKHFVSI